MGSFGPFSILAGLLQLVVPSYALRLVRRFGTQRVGGFVVVAFFSLAILHLLDPLRPAGAAGAAALDVTYIFGSVLLLIGMGHVETLLSNREQAHWREEKLRRTLDSQAQKEHQDLVQANRELTAEISRRESIAKHLEDSEALYRFLFAENPQPMWILDLRSCRFLAVNRAALRQYGFTVEDFMALSGRDLVPAAAAARFLKDVTVPCVEAELRGVWQHCRKDGTLIDVEITAVDLLYAGMPARLILATDITRRLEREKHACNAGRRETAVRIAAGVAQHLNRILTLVEQHTAAALERSHDLSSVERLTQISAAITRGASLTQQLLTVGGQQTIRLEPLDLNGLIGKLSYTLRRMMGENILLDVNFGSSLPAAAADRRLIEHVLVNLVLNARDAMPQGGAVTISTTAVRIGEADAQHRFEARAGEFVCITVRDTGSGISPDVQARLFEPFFTTRGSCHALGLGLASAYGAVRQQGGWIEFTTQTGSGTEFRVFLPCAVTPSGQTTLIKQSKGTVLILEAEDRLRGMAHFVLNRHGYRVIEADCTATALVLWAGQGKYVDLVLTDTQLPDGVCGHDFTHQLRETKPNLKVLYASADSSEPESASDDSLFIRKPYTADALVQAVQQALTPA